MRRLHRLAEGRGLKPVRTVYDDGGFSGGNMERPGLVSLLRDIGSGLIDVVVVYKVDRLTRSLPDFARIVDQFDRKGVSFVSVTQAFNTTTSMGRLTLNALMSFAQFEREVTGERIRDKIAQSKAKGMWMGGAPPLGYAGHERTLKIVPDEATTVRRIFARYLELGSVHQLKLELEQQGVTSKVRVSGKGNRTGGLPINRGALFHMLRNPIYVGDIKHREKVFAGLHEPIINRPTFDAVGVTLAANGGARRARRQSSPALLTGLLKDATGGR
ncbi:recombinase family protein [Brevundimonas sp. Root1423]|uniref:recombinase family protein n=1 Tax=Brevundimonas sp. Root1423 TaxID=1736462 RepID=UPI001F19DE1C|nr:recombinase family protein [Brevundimonas sp. Root1423]